MMIKYHELDARPRSRVKKKSNALFYLGGGLLVLLIVVGFLYLSQKGGRPAPGYKSSSSISGSMAAAEDPRLSDNSHGTGSTSGDNSTEISGNNLITRSSSQSSPFAAASNEPQSEENKTGFTKSLPSENGKISGDSPEKLVATLNNFYTHLDQQSYLQDFKLKELSRVHFSHLVQKLINTPPVVADETDDLFTLLKNTAHFFRILGKNNIVMIKGILDREKSSFENILKTFYALTDHPDVLATEYSLTLPKDALYDYAGFFINTMGGRLYLFRRDSISRMTVSFYSIILMDKANDEGANRYGIDLRPSINSLINEIENTGNSLLLKDEYLDRLYDLKEKYN